MLDKRPALFAMVLLLLIGGSFMQIMDIFAAFFFTDRLPSSSGFAFAFYAIWLPWAAAGICCGIAGGYTILRTNSVRSAYLTAFGVLLLPSLTVDGVRLAWSIFNVTFDFGFPAFKLGGSALGVAFLIWLWVERNAEASLRRLRALPRSSSLAPPDPAA